MPLDPDGRAAAPTPVVDEHRDGLAIYRREVEDAPRVVLVHGAMDRAGGFVKVLRRLGDLDVVRYDRRGYGRSRGDGVGINVDIDGHVRDLFTVLDGTPATVVGHSLGGVIALAAAERRPDLVVSVGAFEAPMPWLSWWPPMPAGGAATVDAHDPEAAGLAAERFLRRMVGDRTWDRFPPAMQRDRRGEGPALVAEFHALRDGAGFRSEQITVPVLAGHGTETATRHRQATRLLAETAPRGELFVIDGATHGAHFTHAPEFAEFVRRAVARATDT